MSYSTEDCKEFIADRLSDIEDFDSEPGEWKRTRKYKSDTGTWLRDFIHTSGRTITLEERKDLQIYKQPVVSNDIYDMDIFCKRLESDIGTSDSDDMYHYIYDVFSNFSQVEKDMQAVESDYENIGNYGNHCGLHTLECGIPVFIYAHGGDWESPIEEALYWTGTEWRGYVPKLGNAYNYAEKSAFGNNDNDEQAVIDQYSDLMQKYWPGLSEDRYLDKLQDLMEKPELAQMFMDDLNQHVASQLRIPLTLQSPSP